MSETSEPQLALIALEGLRREYGMTVQLRRDGDGDGIAGRPVGTASSLDELWSDVRRRRGTEVSPEWGMPSPVVRSIAAPPKHRRASIRRAFDFDAVERLTRRRPSAGGGPDEPRAATDSAASSAVDPAIGQARSLVGPGPGRSPTSGPAIADVWTARAVGPNGDDVWAASAPSAYEAVCRLAERLDESGIA